MGGTGGAAKPLFWFLEKGWTAKGTLKGAGKTCSGIALRQKGDEPMNGP